MKDFFIFLSIQLKIRVKLSRTKEIKKIDLKTGSTVGELLQKIRIKPDTIIVMSGDTLIPVDDVLNDGQELTIIQVSSGG